MLMLLCVHVTSVLFLVQFNNFTLTTYGLPLELHALTLVARSYALLSIIHICRAIPEYGHDVDTEIPITAPRQLVISVFYQHLVASLLVAGFFQDSWRVYRLINGEMVELVRLVANLGKTMATQVHNVRYFFPQSCYTRGFGAFSTN